MMCYEAQRYKEKIWCFKSFKTKMKCKYQNTPNRPVMSPLTFLLGMSRF